MLRVWIVFALVSGVVVSLCGCGGGDGSSGSTVAIEQYSIFGNPNVTRVRFFPRTVSVVAGIDNGITWINQAPDRHQIVSGIVVPDGDPGVVRQITINFGNITPMNLEARAGNTIQISNLSGRTFTMQIVNDNGQVVSTLVFAIGEMKTVVFPGPGVWIIQDPDSQLMASVTLYGTPQPDGRFQSGILIHGGVFQRAFPTPGTYPYFDSNPDDPSHVYATGTIVVQ